MANEQVIGVLFVGDRYVRSYIAWEMSILSTLAAHASVAIGNARLFEQAQLALQQASAANALLTRQTNDARVENGRAHVCTPVTNEHLVCRLLLEKKKYHRKSTQ